MTKDLFSQQNSFYAKYRPTYPAELYEYILSYVQEKNIAWDCGTGNGQAAYALASYFKKVIATDISNNQLALAKQHSNIEYIICQAEKTSFPPNTFDLITVAQAYHWFEFNSFEKELKRVSKSGAVIAVWGYNRLTTFNKDIDVIIDRFYEEITGPYWDAERKYVDANYKTIPFNFKLLPEKAFSIFCNWSLTDLLGYLNSWSAVQHYIAANNNNPVNLIRDELFIYWKENEIRQVCFPLFLKLGKV